MRAFIDRSRNLYTASRLRPSLSWISSIGRPSQITLDHRPLILVQLGERPREELLAERAAAPRAVLLGVLALLLLAQDAPRRRRACSARRRPRRSCAATRACCEWRASLRCVSTHAPCTTCLKRLTSSPFEVPSNPRLRLGISAIRIGSELHRVLLLLRAQVAVALEVHELLHTREVQRHELDATGGRRPVRRPPVGQRRTAAGSCSSPSLTSSGSRAASTI